MPQPDIRPAQAKIMDSLSGESRPVKLGQFGIVTLLEESKSQPDCEAFFLAATLLETLIEHFEVKEEAVKLQSPCVGSACSPCATTHLPT